MGIVLIVLITGGLFAACNRDRQGPAGPPERVTIAITTTTDSVLAQIAQAKGFFREAGVEATVHLHPYGKPALEEVLAGQADFATVAETPIMFAILGGAKLAVIATIESSQKGNALVARKDRGILTPGDLKGKKVAVTKGTTSDYYLDAFLAVNGVARGEVEVVDMRVDDMIEALADGAVDALSTFATYAIPARKRLGERGVIFRDENIYTFTFNLVATQDFVRANPDKVRKVLRGLVRAEEFAGEYPAEAREAVAGFSGVDIDIAREIWGETSFRVALDQMLILALEDESRWAIENRLTSATKVPNYLDAIFFDGLRAVKPAGVRITR